MRKNGNPYPVEPNVSRMQADEKETGYTSVGRKPEQKTILAARAPHARMRQSDRERDVLISKVAGARNRQLQAI